MSILTQEQQEQTVQHHVYIVMYRRGFEELRLSKNEIIDMHENFSESARGISCQFMVYEGIGIKRYRNVGDRDRAYKNQLIGHSVDIGTRVGMKFDVRNEANNTTHYYMTVEVAEHVGKDYYEKQTSRVIEYICESMNIEVNSINEIISILEMFKRASEFMDISDMHMKNIGYNDGKPIIIDFGEDNMHM